VALKAKSASDRRQSKERQAAGRAASLAFDDIRLSEARTLLDEELVALSERYRTPILLCCLAATTQEEAARQLGCSLATLKRRLTKGRELLRVRLARRGLTLSAVLTPALFAPVRGAAAAMMLSNPSALARTLAEGALQAMTAAKLKIAAALVLAVSVLTAGMGLLMLPGHSQPQAAPSPGETGLPKMSAVHEARKDCFGDDLPPGALARLGTVRFRQGNWIYSLDLSPDGRKLITVGGNSRLHLWDIATGKEIHHFPDEQRSMTTYAAAFSPDGRTFATGGSFGFSLWQTNTGKRLYTMEWSTVYSLSFTPDGKALATGTLHKGPALWDATSGEKIADLQEQAAGASTNRVGLHSLAFAPNGRLLASTHESSVTLWDMARRKEIHRLEGHDKPVHTAAFSPDGKLLASGGGDKTIRLCDAATGRELRQFKGHQATVESLVFSTDGKTLISGSGCSPIFPGTTERRALRFWDVVSGEERGAIDEQGCDFSACFLALSRDGKLLVAADGGCVRLWDPATRQEVRRLGGHRHWISGIAFAPDGKRLATASGDCTVRLWDAATGHPLRAFAGGDAAADSVVFSPDGRTIAAASRDGILRLWETSSGREILRIRGHEAGETFVAFSPDGTRLASASRDATAALWDVATGKELHRFKRDFDGFLCVAFSPDGKRIAASEIYGKQHMRLGKGPDEPHPLVRVWDVANGKQIYALKGHTSIIIRSIAFSPDGANLPLRVWTSLHAFGT
jgi:WD40 repeat protein